MTALDLDGIKARAEAATPGPWEAHGQEHPGWVIDRIGADDDDPGDGIAYLDSLRHADAAFIAHAREDVPALVAEVERLTRVKDAALAELDVSLEARDRRAEREVERLRAALTQAKKLAEMVVAPDGSAVSTYLNGLGKHELAREILRADTTEAQR